MNREIKFRAFDTSKKGAFNGFIYSDNGLYDFFAELEQSRIEYGCEWELGQFTGRYDIHRTEIYEGDVVDAEGLIADVIYSERWTEFKVRTAHSLGWYNNIGVIGNIYQDEFKHLI